MLVGRDVELERLDRAVAALRGGAARSFLVLGDAGIGKTALLHEVADRGRRGGALVLGARAAEYEGDVPFGLAINALDEHVATLHPARVATIARDLGDVLPSVGGGDPVTAGPAERFRLHRALRALLEHLARERPVVLVLDDVHWADPASVEWALHLLRRPPAAGVLLLVALRPVDPADDLVDAVRSARDG
jgi:predicted ATPase